MKAVRLYILPLFLLAVSVVLAVRAAELRKRADELRRRNFCADICSDLVRRAASARPKAGTQEILAVKDAVEGIALKHGINLNLEVRGSVISGSPPPDESRHVLLNYGGILSFLTSLSSLPFSIELKSLCIGRACRGGLTLELRVR